MDQKSNLYVFEKKEVALIFLFMILIGITSFILGVKLGKSYTYQQEGFTASDRAQVEMFSKQEEHVQNVVADQNQKKAEQEKTEGKSALKEEMNSSLKKKIMEQIAKESDRGAAPNSAAVKKSNAASLGKVDKPLEKSAASVSKPAPSNDNLSGKYTLQVGVFKESARAKNFAEGIKLRGYNTYIDEIQGRKSLLYRVSLGVFNNVSEAKEYMVKEKSFFEGESPIIVRFE
jgi:cell division septation protein DedD